MAPGGVKEDILVTIATPPVGVKNQSTCNPAPAVTDKAGIGVPWQALGFDGLDAAGTGGQLQLGAFTVWLAGQEADVDALISTLIPAGIFVIIKLPALPVTVPTDAVSVAPLVVVTATEYVNNEGAH